MSKKNYHDYEMGPVDGEMRKYRRYEAPQCTSYDTFCAEKKPEHRRCQGVKGHTGWHWYYSPDGWLIQWPYRKDVKRGTDTCHSDTPPNHKHYIHPKDKWNDCHKAHAKTIDLGPAKE